MIDNPLENQTLETYDGLYINEKFEEHCTDAAKELAKEYNLNPDYYEKYIIDLWWDHNKDLYETKTPYLK